MTNGESTLWEYKAFTIILMYSKVGRYIPIQEISSILSVPYLWPSPYFLLLFLGVFTHSPLNSSITWNLTSYCSYCLPLWPIFFNAINILRFRWHDLYPFCLFKSCNHVIPFSHIMSSMRIQTRAQHTWSLVPQNVALNHFN